MEIIDFQHQNMRHKYGEQDEDEELKQQQHQGRTRTRTETEDIQQENKQNQQPSPASSPSHEFSFTISLQPASSSSSSSVSTSSSGTTSVSADKSSSSSKSSPPSFALDLSPADEIFFHGHLLPLHLLSHLPVSPRSSTNSMDSFTLPIKDLHDHHRQDRNSTSTQRVHNPMNRRIIDEYYETTRERTNGRPTKSKTFSLFGLSSKWRKDDTVTTTTRSSTTTTKLKEKEDITERQKRKLKFDSVSHVLKRYIRMVRPLLSFGNRRNHGGNARFHHREGFSYSGNLSLRRNKPAELIVGRRRGEFSAPASMRTSPNHSGILVASGPVSPRTKSDSTMEELQTAIQAAIAHCKNSIAVEDKIKCPVES